MRTWTIGQFFDGLCRALLMVVVITMPLFSLFPSQRRGPAMVEQDDGFEEGEEWTTLSMEEFERATEPPVVIEIIEEQAEAIIDEEVIDELQPIDIEEEEGEAQPDRTKPTIQREETGGGKPKGKKCIPRPHAKIVPEGRNRYVVQRSLLLPYLDDFESASKLAAVGPHRGEKGKIVGFELGRIRCNGTVYSLGFRNKDVITEVDGKKLRDVFDALAIPRKLRKQERILVTVLRKGKTIRLRYRFE